MRITNDACTAISNGHRYVLASSRFHDPDHVKEVLTKMSHRLGMNVRASGLGGVIVIYGEGAEDDGVGVVISGVETTKPTVNR